jgi:adenine/guanine phosphoribosyltransferase-like PRPP-binding protein
MTQAELDEAIRQAKVEVVEANRAVAQAVADERTRPPTLAATLGELQRKKRRHWR